LVGTQHHTSESSRGGWANPTVFPGVRSAQTNRFRSPGRRPANCGMRSAQTATGGGVCNVTSGQKKPVRPENCLRPRGIVTSELVSSDTRIIVVNSCPFLSCVHDSTDWNRCNRCDEKIFRYVVAARRGCNPGIDIPVSILWSLAPALRDPPRLMSATPGPVLGRSRMSDQVKLSF
jgi:hypothetical protein